MKKPKSVYTYLQSAPPKVRLMLKEMRSIIKAAAPSAQEKISYGMPYYSYKGRLAYFGFAANHIGLYIPTPIIAKHKKELKGYSYAASGATVRFPLDKKLPAALIKKLVRARMKMNEQRGKKIS